MSKPLVCSCVGVLDLEVMSLLMEKEQTGLEVSDFVVRGMKMAMELMSLSMGRIIISMDSKQTPTDAMLRDSRQWYRSDCLQLE